MYDISMRFILLIYRGITQVHPQPTTIAWERATETMMLLSIAGKASKTVSVGTDSC